MKALLIVDVQNDFLPGGNLEVPDGDEVIPGINRLEQKFQYMVATQDWHSADHQSFASRHSGKDEMETGKVGGERQVLWPDHCVQGTEGAQFPLHLAGRKVGAIVRKGTLSHVDSYSGFYDMNQENSTGLAGLLREKGVDEIFICGLATDVCVKFTALDGVEEGFKVRVVTDAVRGVNLEEGDVEKAMEEMAGAGVEFVDSLQIPTPAQPG